MNKIYIPAASLLLVGMVLISGCGNPTQSGTNPSQQPNTSSIAESSADTSTPAASSEQQEATNTDSTSNESSNAATNDAAKGSSESEATASATDSDETANSKEILIVIDQTEKPIENAGMFNFSIQHLPKGYRLDKMSWTGEGKPVINTYQQAIENGGTGGPESGSFYISGDGQFSGFSYPESRKGEQGTVAFMFVNDAGSELKWEKKITLK